MDKQKGTREVQHNIFLAGEIETPSTNYEKQQAVLWKTS